MQIHQKNIFNATKKIVQLENISSTSSTLLQWKFMLAPANIACVLSSINFNFSILSCGDDFDDLFYHKPRSEWIIEKVLRFREKFFWATFLWRDVVKLNFEYFFYFKIKYEITQSVVKISKTKLMGKSIDYWFDYTLNAINFIFYVCAIARFTAIKAKDISKSVFPSLILLPKSYSTIRKLFRTAADDVKVKVGHARKKMQSLSPRSRA